MVVRYNSRKSLFDSDADVLVNSVNIKGIMGAGIAKEFARRFPEMYKDYRRACRKGEVYIYAKFEVYIKDKIKRLKVHEIYDWRPHIWVGAYKGRRILILNFPTKIYWDLPSDYKIIEAGLRWLRSNIDKLSKELGQEIRKIAMPQLGCNLGGLKWSKVKELIEKYFKDHEVEIEVFIYTPRRKSRPGLESK